MPKKPTAKEMLMQSAPPRSTTMPAGGQSSVNSEEID